MGQIAKALQRANYLKPVADAIATIRKAQKYDELLQQMAQSYNRAFGEYGSVIEPTTFSPINVPPVQDLGDPRTLIKALREGQASSQTQRNIRPIEPQGLVPQEEVKKTAIEQIADIYRNYFSDITKHQQNIENLLTKKAQFGQEVARMMLGLDKNEREQIEPVLRMFDINIDKMIDAVRKNEPAKPFVMDLGKKKFVIGKDSHGVIEEEQNPTMFRYQTKEKGKVFEVIEALDGNGNVLWRHKIEVGTDPELIKQRKEDIKEQEKLAKEEEEYENKLIKTKEKALSNLNEFLRAYDVHIGYDKNLYFKPKTTKDSEIANTFVTYEEMQGSLSTDKINQAQREHLKYLRTALDHSRDYLIDAGFEKFLDHKRTRKVFEEIYKNNPDLMKTNPYLAIKNHIEGKAGDTTPRNRFMLTTFLFSELVTNYPNYKDIFK